MRIFRLLMPVFILSLLLFLSGTAVAEPPDPAESTRPLRVVTYNVLHGGLRAGLLMDPSHLETRMEMAIAELKALDADIIALQEASQSRLADVPGRMAAALGYHHVYAPATDHVIGLGILDTLAMGIVGFKEGSAILSRYPIAASHVYDLPHCRKWLDPRILLRTEITTPWGPLQIFSTHISRDACQIDRISEIVRANRNDRPLLLMGDFNTTEDSPALTPLRDGVVDVFRYANPKDRGLTVWQRIEEVQPTVFRRVDYIFLIQGTESAGQVRSSRLVLNKPGKLPDGTTLWPSDHYGVLAEIDILKNKPNSTNFK